MSIVERHHGASRLQIKSRNKKICVFCKGMKIVNQEFSRQGYFVNLTVILFPNYKQITEHFLFQIFHNQMTITQ